MKVFHFRLNKGYLLRLYFKLLSNMFIYIYSFNDYDTIYQDI